MKLKNKLIPFAVIAAIPAVTTPLALTSCKHSIFEGSGAIDVLNGYFPTIAKLPAYEGKTESEIEELYIKDFNDNKDILLQDLAWWESSILPIRMQNAEAFFDSGSLYQQGLTVRTWQNQQLIQAKPTRAVFEINSPVINTVSVVNPTTQEKMNVHTISMELNYEFDYEVVAHCYQTLDASKTAVAKQVSVNRYTSTYKNIPFAIKYNAKYGTYEMQTIGYLYNNKWLLDKIDGWEFGFNYDYSYTDTTTHSTGQTYECYEADNEHNVINTVVGLKQAIQDLAITDPSSGSINYYIFDFGLYHTLDVQAPELTTTYLGYAGYYSWYGDVFQKGEYKYSHYGNPYTNIGDESSGNYNDIRLGGISYNYSYKQKREYEQVTSIKLDLTENLSLPIYGYPNWQVFKNDGTTPMCMEITKDAELFYGRSWWSENSYSAPIWIPATLAWSESQPWASSHTNYFTWDNYYTTIPAGNYKVIVTLYNQLEGKEVTKNLVIPVDHDVFLTWDEFLSE